MSAINGLAALLRGWVQLKVNDSEWPTFDDRYAKYPRFKREWAAYRETYHSVVNDDLAAKTLREKCVKGDALRMVSHLMTCKRYGILLTPVMKDRRNIWRRPSDR
jgi:hypothetical protein